ncbi:Glutathione transferase 3 [Nakaseomyces bracarensis]|uniref:Glutathione transferase 3 n=1 Tax=Nakaseomyces bracarensis TaxID=273131 RepID=A0ABR4NWQ7_9SACH
MSSFSKWRKAELFDLMNKLKITDVSHSTRKSTMIMLIEHYLDNLEAPLDYIHDFPELQSFYEDRAQLKIESDVDDIDLNLGGNGELDTDADADAEDTDVGMGMGLGNTTDDYDDLYSRTPLGKEALKQELDQVAEKAQAQSHAQTHTQSQAEAEAEAQENTDESVHDNGYKNELDFNKIHDKMADFRFEFEKRWDDIVDKSVVLNENLKDYLSSISTVETIFTLVELALLIHHLCNSYKPVDVTIMSPEGLGPRANHIWSNFTLFKHQVVHFLNEIGLPVFTWFFLLRLLPCLVSYYINFIRYDLLLQMDPMVYHLFKLIIEFMIVNKYSRDSSNTLEGFLKSFSFSPIAHLHVDPCQDLKSFYDATGFLPLVFSTVCVILTLYIL